MCIIADPTFKSDTFKSDKLKSDILLEIFVKIYETVVNLLRHILAAV